MNRISALWNSFFSLIESRAFERLTDAFFLFLLAWLLIVFCARVL